MSGYAVRAYEGHKEWPFPASLIKKTRKHVEYWQRTLFGALKAGWKLRVINRFKRLLENSYFNKLLSIHKVTRLNNGKKTAGIDGVKIQIKTRGQLEYLRDRLFKDLNRDKWKPKPNRRINIPKPDGITRPLGIPTQDDRIVQAVLTTILDFEVESLINNHQISSFGFRKKIGTADAISNLTAYAHKGKHALLIEADISKCFDRISHEYIIHLLRKAGETLKSPIRKLLMAGHWDLESQSQKITDMGTPQGGIMSPALSNLVRRNTLDLPFQELKIKNAPSTNLITYADDLIITISPRATIITDNQKLIKWPKETTEFIMSWLTKQLAIAGLELKPSKTRVITNSTPFDFLGYEIARGKGIRMAKDKVQRLRVKIKETMKRGRNATRVKKELNPILRGFYNYAAKFSSGKMWKQIGKIDWDVENRLHKLYKQYDIGQVK